jgi:NAD(P)-dependent dehydrogenase (short-subunit alcohol dehydrogenase family)
MDTIFKNKVAIITGSSYGIGKATAICFAKKGASIVLSDWEEDVDTLNTIKSFGGKAIFIKADVSKESDVKNIVAETIKNFGRLDYAFNNAGIEGQQGIIHESSNDNWEKVIGINLTGVYYCMKHQIPEMLKTGGGVIVNNSSIAGLVGFSGVPAYVASKHALVGLTKNVALDYAKQNIRVNAVCPGVIQTPMIDRFTGGSKDVADQMAAAKPMGRLGTPEEIANTVAFLCSDDASFITGQALAVDGGWVTQ